MLYSSSLIRLRKQFNRRCTPEGKVSDSIDKPEQNEEQREEAYVSKKAYEGVSNDMHKFKSKAKEAEARAAELELRLKAIEEEKMQELNQWEELAKKRAEELEVLQRQNAEKEQRAQQLAKRTALKLELGDVRDEYLMHANLNAITINEDGSINKESVHEVANDFRTNHASLLPQKAASGSTNAPAASDFEPQEITKDELYKLMQGKDVHERMAIARKYEGKIKEN